MDWVGMQQKFWFVCCYFVLFSCPEQLNRWSCHSLTESLSHSLTFTFTIQRAILEWPWRFVTFETLDPQMMTTFYDNFWSRYSITIQSQFFDDIQSQFSITTLKSSITILKRLRFSMTILKRQSWRLVTFETLITVLTIENLKSW